MTDDTAETELDATLARDDHESILQLLADLRRLILNEDLQRETILLAIDHALSLAIGGPPEQARDFVQDVVMGRLEPFG